MNFNILVIGQGQGGNALLWRDYYNNRSQDEFEYTYICRNYCQEDMHLRHLNDRLYKPYNKFGKGGILAKLWAIYIARVGMIKVVRKLCKEFDISHVHLHGNYSPKLNLKILNASANAKSILTFYGSDYYQNVDKNNCSLVLTQILERVDAIVFNFEVMYEDFISNFPQFKNKSSVGCLGISSDVLESYSYYAEKPKSPIRLLSTRGLYKYNNVHHLVDAFIDLYAGNPNYQLDILNGYGWDDEIVKYVKQRAKDVPNIQLRIGEWLSDDELKNYYHNAHYNFCIGDTDQMTVSIIYGFLSKCINVLSPLRNYEELTTAGLRSHITLAEVSRSQLHSFLQNLNPYVLSGIQDLDAIKVKKYFAFSNRYENVREIIRGL